MTMRYLHGGAKWIFRFQGYSMFFVVAVLFSSFLMTSFFSLNDLLLKLVFVVFVLAIVLVLIFGEIYARMSYNRWKYDFTDTNLKKESGIIWKKYSNIPYDRVQNVDIRRGILARILGFSSVMIQTAGYSGVGTAEGNIPAVSVEEAEEIRDFLMKKISRNVRGGL